MFLNVDMLTLGRGGIGEHRSRVKMIKMIIKSGFPPPHHTRLYSQRDQMFHKSQQVLYCYNCFKESWNIALHSPNILQDLYYNQI